MLPTIKSNTIIKLYVDKELLGITLGESIRSSVFKKIRSSILPRMCVGCSVEN